MEKQPRKVVSNACDHCKQGKRRCDGKHPCSYCQKGNKECQYTQVDKRRRKATMSPSVANAARLASEPPSFPVASTSTNPANPQASPSSLSNSTLFTSAALAGPSSSPALPTPPLFAPASVSARATAAEDTKDSETLASLARAIGNEGHDAATPDARDSANPIVGIYRHLTRVFSLRSLPQGALDEEEALFEGEADLSSFFLPPEQEGLEFVRCFFNHAASTYRYLDEDDVNGLAQRFFAQDPTVIRDPILSALVLVVMAVGCLWMPSYVGADAAIMTPRAIKLYLAAKRRTSSTSMVPARLPSVQLHLATTHLFLGLSRYQSAWLSFGTAARLSLLLGLHRASPLGTDADVDAKRRRVFWSALMMDRFLSLILGLPAFYNEADVSQPLPDIGAAVSPQATTSTETQKMLIGSVAHFKLSRIMGHALDALRSPKDLSPADRQLRIGAVEGELQQWQQETPNFFHPEVPEMALFGEFAQVPPIFERQQWRVRSTFQFIRLLLYRSYLLDELLGRLRRTPVNSPTSAAMPSGEINICVRAALYIAQTASAMQGKTISGGTFWNTAYFAFSSVAVLLVYLSLYPDASNRAEVEQAIDRAMQANEGYGGDANSFSRHQLLDETRRISSLLKPSPPSAGPPQPQASTSNGAQVDFGGGLSGMGRAGDQPMPDLTFPFLFGETGVVPAGTDTTNWEELFADLQGLVETGFDTDQQFFPPTF
ncbi:hypothetical protein JCM8097_000167 [Rhodosporidiobolus ruineniae]